METTAGVWQQSGFTCSAAHNFQHTPKSSRSRICRGVGTGKQVGSMDEESQVRGCYNFYLYTNQPGNSVGSPLR